MAACVAVACLVIVLIVISGRPGTSSRPRASAPSAAPAAPSAPSASATPSATVRWTFDTGYDVNTRPAVAGGTVYVSSRDGKVHALDAGTGRLRWTYAIGGSVDSGPAVAGGTVYVASDDDTVYALDAATGGLRWTYTTGDCVYSSPAVAGGTVYVGSDRRHGVRAGCRHRSPPLDLHHRSWRRHPAWRWRAAPSTSAATDGTVYALDAATGRLRWAYTTAGSVDSSPAVAGGTVYVGGVDGDDGTVYALDAATGRLRWSYTTGGCSVGLQPGGGGRHRLRRQRRRHRVRAGCRHRPPPLDLHHRRCRRNPARRWRAAPSTSAVSTARCTRWTPGRSIPATRLSDSALRRLPALQAFDGCGRPAGQPMYPGPRIRTPADSPDARHEATDQKALVLGLALQRP